MYVIEALFNNILPCDSSQVQESEGPVMREGADKNPPEEESLMLTEAPHRNSEWAYANISIVSLRDRVYPRCVYKYIVIFVIDLLE